MSEEIFRRIDPEKTEPASAVETPEVKESFDSQVETPIEKKMAGNLELWETESKKKYVSEYFDTHNISSDFSVKMSLGAIDKFVRAELESRGYDKTTENYRAIMKEVEEEIGSSRLELFKRFGKITGYLRVLQRLRDAKQKLGAYKPDESA